MPPHESAFELVAELYRSFGERLEQEAVRRKTDLPNSATQPVGDALRKAYLSRLEIHIDTIRRGDEVSKGELPNLSTLQQELREFGVWILSSEAVSRRPTFSREFEESIGDALVSVGCSYSKTRQMLRQSRQIITGRGAPNKRPETLKMLDARVANGWSYSRLASEMCDCGARKHTSHCAESIRKRIKGLEEFLNKYKIVYGLPI